MTSTSVSSNLRLCNQCSRYLLSLALSFKHLSYLYNNAYRYTNCPDCLTEKIEILITNRITNHQNKITTHITQANIDCLLKYLEQWRLEAHDFDFTNFRSI